MCNTRSRCCAASLTFKFPCVARDNNQISKVNVAHRRDIHLFLKKNIIFATWEERVAIFKAYIYFVIVEFETHQVFLSPHSYLYCNVAITELIVQLLIQIEFK